MSYSFGRYSRWGIANFFADLLALKSQSLFLRYATISGTSIALCIAALLFRTTVFWAAIASIALAFSVVLLVIWFWVEDAFHRRRLLLKIESPTPRDGVNPDLRDEVIIACVGLLVIVPVALYLINDGFLGFQVQGDRFGLKQSLCADQSSLTCALTSDLFRLQSWFLFTVEHFVANAPFGGFLSTWIVPNSGVSKTGFASSIALLAIQLLFGGLIFKLVTNYYSKTNDQIRDAIDLLRVSSFMAAGMGPIAVRPLLTEIKRVEKVSGKEVENVSRNAFEALLEISSVYPDAPELADAPFRDAVLARFRRMLERANADTNGGFDRDDLRIAASIVCAARITEGVRTIVEEIKADKPGHYKRMELVEAIIVYCRGEEREKALSEIMVNDPWKEVAKRIDRFRNIVDLDGETRISGRKTASL